MTQPAPVHRSLAYNQKGLMEVGQSIEDERRALEAEGAVKIRKIEVDFEHFEVSKFRLALHSRYPVACSWRFSGIATTYVPSQILSLSTKIRKTPQSLVAITPCSEAC